MLTNTSPMSEIALEAKGTSDDVRQTALSIESSVKQIDSNVSKIPLSQVPEWIDNFPVDKPEIAPGFIGYGIDVSKNEYDVTHKFQKQTDDGSQFRFSYNDKFKVPIDVAELHMFSDGNVVQRGTSVIYFSDPLGNEIKRVTEPYTPHTSYMYHGSFYGGQESDLYLTGVQQNNAGSKYYINTYNSSGELLFTTFIKSEHYSYYDFAFDGDYYYFLTRHASGDTLRCVDRHDLNGNYIDSYTTVPASYTNVNCTENYVVCFFAMSRNPVCIKKDMTESFEINSPSSYNYSYVSSMPLYGLDSIAVKFGTGMTFFDLIKRTSKYFGNFNPGYLSYFGSYALFNNGTTIAHIDRFGEMLSLTSSSSPRTFTQIASNVKTVIGKYVLEKHAYTNKAIKTDASLAKKREVI